MGTPISAIDDSGLIRGGIVRHGAPLPDRLWSRAGLFLAVLIIVASLAAQAFAQEVTPTNTPTPTPSRTPTPPEGCAYFVAPVSATRLTWSQAGPDETPVWQGCFTNVGGELALGAVHNITDEPFQNTSVNLLLRWDAPPQPAGYTVSAAWLRVHPDFVAADDDLALGADWHSWQTCGASNATQAELSGALSGVALSSVVPGRDNDWPLDDASDALSGGGVGLRLGVPFDENVTGFNTIMTAGTGPTRPRLVVLACGTPIPTPTPPSDCEWQIIPATPNGADVHATGTSFPLAFEECAAGATREASVAPTDGPEALYTSSSPLITWDTRGLPANRVITDARLRLHVADAQADDGDALSLGGDWYLSESCSETDALGENPPTDALSSDGACAAACTFSNIGSGQDVDFPLDNSEANVQRHGITGLRLHADGTPTGINGVQFADGSGTDPGPRLALQMCVPTPAPEDGCVIVTAPLETIQAVSGSGTNFPPSFDICTDPGETAEASIDQESSFTSGKLLLSWNTTPTIPGLLEGGLTTTPPDFVLTRAWLRLHVYDAW